MQKESPSLDRIREWVKHEMGERELTISVLASKTGLSRPWLSNFLNGKVALSFADADILAEYFETSLSDMISEKITA